MRVRVANLDLYNVGNYNYLKPYTPPELSEFVDYVDYIPVIDPQTKKTTLKETKDVKINWLKENITGEIKLTGLYNALIVNDLYFLLDRVKSFGSNVYLYNLKRWFWVNDVLKGNFKVIGTLVKTKDTSFIESNIIHTIPVRAGGNVLNYYPLIDRTQTEELQIKSPDDFFRSDKANYYQLPKLGERHALYTEPNQFIEFNMMYMPIPFENWKAKLLRRLFVWIQTNNIEVWSFDNNTQKTTFNQLLLKYPDNLNKFYVITSNVAPVPRTFAIQQTNAKTIVDNTLDFSGLNDIQIVSRENINTVIQPTPKEPYGIKVFEGQKVIPLKLKKTSSVSRDITNIINSRYPWRERELLLGLGLIRSTTKSGKYPNLLTSLYEDYTLLKYDTDKNQFNNYKIVNGSINHGNDGKTPEDYKNVQPKNVQLLPGIEYTLKGASGLVSLDVYGLYQGGNDDDDDDDDHNDFDENNLRLINFPTNNPNRVMGIAPFWAHNPQTNQKKLKLFNVKGFRVPLRNNTTINGKPYARWLLFEEIDIGNTRSLALPETGEFKNVKKFIKKLGWQDTYSETFWDSDWYLGFQDPGAKYEGYRYAVDPNPEIFTPHVYYYDGEAGYTNRNRKKDEDQDPDKQLLRDKLKKLLKRLDVWYVADYICAAVMTFPKTILNNQVEESIKNDKNAQKAWQRVGGDVNRFGQYYYSRTVPKSENVFYAGFVSKTSNRFISEVDYNNKKQSWNDSVSFSELDKKEYNKNGQTFKSTVFADNFKNLVDLWFKNWHNLNQEGDFFITDRMIEKRSSNIDNNTYLYSWNDSDNNAVFKGIGFEIGKVYQKNIYTIEIIFSKEHITPRKWQYKGYFPLQGFRNCSVDNIKNIFWYINVLADFKGYHGKIDNQGKGEYSTDSHYLQHRVGKHAPNDWSHSGRNRLDVWELYQRVEYQITDYKSLLGYVELYSDFNSFDITDIDIKKFNDITIAHKNDLTPIIENENLYDFVGTNFYVYHKQHFIDDDSGGSIKDYFEIIVKNNDIVLNNIPYKEKVLKTGTDVVDLAQVINSENTLSVYGRQIPLKWRGKLTEGLQFDRLSVVSLDVESVNPPYDVFLLDFKSSTDSKQELITLLRKQAEVKTEVSWADYEDLSYKLKQDLLLNNLRHQQINQERVKFGDMLEKEEQKLQYRESTEWMNWVGSGLGVASSLAAGFANPVLFMGAPGTIMNAAKSFMDSKQSLQQARADFEFNRHWGQEEFKLKTEINNATFDQANTNTLMQIRRLTYNSSFGSVSDASLYRSLKTHLKTGDIFLISTYPEGELLDAIKRYYDDFGYDIVYNNYSLTSDNIKPGDVWKFSEIKELQGVKDPDIYNYLLQMFKDGFKVEEINKPKPANEQVS